MAKIKNPIYSLSASGSIGGILSFRSTAGGSVCTKKPGSYAQQTTGQLANQQQMIDARKSFKLLTQKQLQQWQARANAVKLKIWPEYFREYQNQMVTYPNQPLIPEPYI